MTFKDQLQNDLDTFLNTNEFAEEYSVEVGGESALVTGVLDDDEDGQPEISPDDGTYLVRKVFYCKSADLPNTPVIGRVISVNGENYMIANISRAGGMTELTLEVYGSGA